MSIRLDYMRIREYVAKVFVSSGLSEENALTVADNLVAADLRGVYSHGLVQVRTYVNMYEQGKFNSSPDIREIKESPAALLIDADRGPGAVVGKYAMKRTIEKAKAAGIAVTAVRNATHFGMAAYYAMDALKEDMIGFAFTNAGALVAPFGGYSRELGTNPVCIAAPAKKHLPFVFDAATSQQAFNKIFFAYTEGREIPDNWAMDSRGQATTNPSDIIDGGGALYPFGGYKGYGLGMAVNILTGILSGACTDYGNDGAISENVYGIGYNFAAIDISKFISVEEFKSVMDAFIERIKNSGAVNEETPVLIPGEPEFFKEEKAKREGIEIYDGVIADLRYVGEKAGLDISLEDCVIKRP